LPCVLDVTKSDVEELWEVESMDDLVTAVGMLLAVVDASESIVVTLPTTI